MGIRFLSVVLILPIIRVGNFKVVRKQKDSQRELMVRIGHLLVRQRTRLLYLQSQVRLAYRLRYWILLMRLRPKYWSKTLMVEEARQLTLPRMVLY